MRGDVSALETELRQSEDRIVSLETELRQLRTELDVAQRESDHLRGQLVAGGEQVLMVEQADTLFRAEGLRVNKLLTGGLNEDGQPGDEVVHLMLEPIDADGHVLKLPGEVQIEVTDPAAPAGTRQLGQWRFSDAEAREAWHSSLFASGLKFRLPLSHPTRNGTVVVFARLKTADGRQFDATETVRLKTSSGNVATAGQTNRR